MAVAVTSSIRMKAWKPHVWVCMRPSRVYCREGQLRAPGVHTHSALASTAALKVENALGGGGSAVYRRLGVKGLDKPWALENLTAAHCAALGKSLSASLEP